MKMNQFGEDESHPRKRQKTSNLSNDFVYTGTFTVNSLQAEKSRQKKNYYLTTMARSNEENGAKGIREKCKKASRTFWKKENTVSHPPKASKTTPSSKNYFDLADRKSAIIYLFCYIYGEPTEDEWKTDGGSIISEIMNTLSIPHGSWKSVVKIYRIICS